MQKLAAASNQHKIIYGNVPEGAEALLVAQTDSRVIMHITTSDRELNKFAESLRFFAPDIEVIEFPAWDTLPYDRSSPNPIIIARRIEALSLLAAGLNQDKRHVIVTTVNAVLQRIPAPDIFRGAALILEKGRSGGREDILKYLQKNGYDRVSKVMQPGEYAVRGSIIDLFPSGYDDAIRIDYFGDDIESIRSFDPISQVSTAELPMFRLLPASEIIFDKDSIERFKGNYRKLFGAVLKEDPLYESISQGMKYPGMENWLPLFYENLASIYDYLPSDTLISSTHLAETAAEERLELIKDYYEARRASPSSDYKPLAPEYLYKDQLATRENSVIFTPFSTEATIDSGLRKAFKPGNDFSQLKNYEKPVFISAFSQGSLEHISSLLRSHDFKSSQLLSWAERKMLAKNHIGLFVLPLESGFEDKDFVIISEQDIFGDRFIRTIKKKKSAENLLAEAASIQTGELVVHEEHGIGRFSGLETLEVKGVKHDMVRILYEGDDRLFVPVENIDVISRYGSDDENVRLDKLGGIHWQERKSKLKERIKMAAYALLKVAAERALKVAPVFRADNNLYEDFIARFPYNETEDQLRSIEEVYTDLAGGKPMDRLICGDVGFGKTEVALRAAFSVASGGGQVALICPTTLLARQHAQNFTKRFAGLPIKVSQLSRMVTTAEAKKTKEALAEGKVDIVIGTHALLAEDMKFKNLGLVIIDEEQHFGVAQKERLKKLRAEVHVMALSATPIPRSLQLAMSGVRELSIIATPPVDRLAVRTFVMPFDDLVIREAILRERNRGGRVYYVAPRISDLEELSKKLKKLVPEAKFAVAHGQLTPADLDKIMNQFFDGAFDVLLSTAIVESGLDISTANTLIIHRADMFGLAQLYQLRGRVGRSKTRAYAYLTTEPRKKLTDNALKRLEVIQNLDQLGAGFSLASHDMDIRGFGNLLGEEQSGHIKEVGVELYQKMLQEAVMKARAEKGTGPAQADGFSPDINVGASILIPDYYIEDLNLRMGLYKRAANLKSDEEIDAFRIEMTDRFGKPPREVIDFLEVISLKLLCRQSGIEKIDVGPKAVVMQFHKSADINAEKLMAYVLKNKNSVKIRPDNKLVFAKDGEEDFDHDNGLIRQYLKEIVDCCQ